jgi:hypothetical protein
MGLNFDGGQRIDRDPPAGFSPAIRSRAAPRQSVGAVCIESFSIMTIEQSGRWEDSIVGRQNRKTFSRPLESLGAGPRFNRVLHGRP